jgi:hypothetical protein
MPVSTYTPNTLVHDNYGLSYNTGRIGLYAYNSARCTTKDGTSCRTGAHPSPLKTTKKATTEATKPRLGTVPVHSQNTDIKTHRVLVRLLNPEEATPSPG